MQLLQRSLAIAIFALILAAAFGGGGFLLVRNLPMVLEGWSSRGWPTTAGTITESQAVAIPIVSNTRRGTVGTHVVRLRYDYDVDGRRYTGTRQGLADIGIVREQQYAERDAAALPPGRAVTVHYDPDEPARSLLVPGVPGAGVVGIAIGLLLVIGGGALVAIGLHLRAHHARRRARLGR